jgi:hypothetical protein
VSWLDNTAKPRISGDGRLLAFNDEAADAGVNYASMLRKTDGSPAVRLGEGSLYALSRDDAWTLSVIQTPSVQLMLYPTGTGHPRRNPRREEEGGRVCPGAARDAAPRGARGGVSGVDRADGGGRV